MEDIFAEINADCWSIRRQINDHVHRVNRAIVFGHNDNASSYQVVVVGESTARDCGKIFLDSSTDTLKFVALATGVKVDKVEARLGEAILLKVGSVIEFGEDARDVFDVLRGADVSYGCDLVHEAHGSISTQVGPVYDGGGHPDQKRARAIALPVQRYDTNFLSKVNTETQLNCRICKYRAWNMYGINHHYQREHRSYIHTQTAPLLAYIIYYPKYHTVVRYDQSEFEVKFLSRNNYCAILRFLLACGPAQKPWICPATVRAVEALNMRDCSSAVRNMLYRGEAEEEFKRVAGFSFEPFFWGTNDWADRKLKIKLKRADSSDHVPTAFYKK